MLSNVSACTDRTQRDGSASVMTFSPIRFLVNFLCHLGIASHQVHITLASPNTRLTQPIRRSIATLLALADRGAILFLPWLATLSDDALFE